MIVANQLKVLIGGRKWSEIFPKAPDQHSFNGLEADPPTGGRRPSCIRFDAFLLDLDRGCLFKGDSEITLRPKTLAFLQHLVANPGRVVSKDELLAAIWPDVVVTEDSLVQCVGELRRALDDQGQSLIRTLPKRGYRFDGNVSVEEPSSIPGASAEAKTHLATEALGGWLVRRGGLHAAIALVLGAVALGSWLIWQNPDRTASSAPPASIVVLPFSNLDSYPAQDHLAAGLTTDLTMDLSRIPGTLVIASATAQTFSGSKSDPRQVSRMLNVRYVLEGTIRSNGEQVRIAVQLVDGESGATRWGERFDRRREEIVLWQDEIVSRIAVALDHRLTALESERAVRERPNNPAVFDLTARGWALVYAAKSPDSYDAARALFLQALERDPRATNAIAGLAWSAGISLLNGWSRSSDADEQIARKAAADLLSIDPNHVIGHQVRGFLHRYAGDTAAAKDAFSTAVQINPNFAPAHAQLGVTELELGRPEEAIESAKRAIRLSPRDPNLRSWTAFIGMALVHSERYPQAIPWLSRSVDTATPIALHQAYYLSALALAGRREDSQKALVELLKARPATTITNVRSSARSTNRDFIAQREHFVVGLQLAGLPE